MTNEFSRRALLFGTLLSWCVALLVGRFVLAGSFVLAFLGWNLFLAAIPAVAASLFARAAQKPSHAAIQIFWFAIWLAFLPNAPYIVTDLLHLANTTAVPLWYDLALYTSCAGTGLLLGYTSLADVQQVISRKFSNRLGWILASASLFLSGFGIYLGRFLRWNSWDAFTNPLQVILGIARLLSDSLAAPQMIWVTLVYGISLLLGYIALRVVGPAIGSGSRHMPSNPLPQTNRQNRIGSNPRGLD